jgi:hypothetical protein
MNIFKKMKKGNYSVRPILTVGLPLAVLLALNVQGTHQHGSIKLSNTKRTLPAVEMTFENNVMSL